MLVDSLFRAVVLCTLCAGVAPKPKRSGGGRRQCTAVHQYYNYESEVQDKVLTSWTYDPKLNVCGYQGHKKEQRQTCCSLQTEQSFIRLAERDYRRIVESETSLIRSQYRNITREFEDKFEQLLDAAYTKVLLYLSRGERPLRVSELTATFKGLFTDIRAVLMGTGQPDLMESMERVLDELFVLYYPYASEKPGAVYTKTFSDCLRSVQRRYDVFGQSTQTLTIELEQAVAVSGLYLRGLKVSEKALESVSRYNLSEDCVKDLTKLTHCSKCYGFLQKKPCKGICMEVFNECLNQIRKMEKTWPSHQQVIIALGQMLLGDGPSLQPTLIAIPETVEMFTGHMLRKKPQFEQVISTECGPPVIATQGAPPVAASADSNFSFPEIGIRDSLIRAEEHLRISNERLFAKLPDRICSSEELAGPSDRCWSGLVNSTTKEELEFLDFLAPPPPKHSLLETAKSHMANFGMDVQQLFKGPQSPKDRVREGSGEEGSGDIFYSGDGSGENKDDEKGDSVLSVTTQKLVTVGLGDVSEVTIDSGSNGKVVTASSEIIVNKGDTEIIISKDKNDDDWPIVDVPSSSKGKANGKGTGDTEGGASSVTISTHPYVITCTIVTLLFM